jgi:putative peptidoglycan lipid II flippase
MTTTTTARRGALLNSLIVMGGFVLSRVTGLLRDVVVLAQFGTSPELGAYRVAFTIPDTLYLVVIGGALGSALIPLMLELLERNDQAAAWRLVNATVGWSLLALAALSGLLLVVSGPLVRLLYGGQGFDAPTLMLATHLTRLFLLSPLLLGLGGLALAVLNGLDRFTLPALAPSVYNLGIMAGALLAPHLAPQQPVWGLAWGVIGGAALYLLVQLPGLWAAGLRFAPTLGRDLPQLRTLLRQLAPRLVGQAAAQINIVVTTVLVARLADGAARVVGLGAAYQLMLLPYGVFALSLSTVAFPTLARLYAAKRTGELAQLIRATLATISLLTLPASVALIVLAVPLVRLLFERGAFTPASTALTVAPLWGYAAALPAFAVSEILIRSFYAMHDTRTPVLIGIATIGLNLTLGYLAFIGNAGVVGIALAFSVANNLEALLLVVLMRRRLPGIWRDPALQRSLRAAVLASLALLAVLGAALALSQPLLPWLVLTPDQGYRFPQDAPTLLLWLFGVGGLGALVYVGVVWLAGADELRALLRRIGR